MEQWKTITYASNYEVSTEGKVRNKTTKYILKGRLSKSGYLQVSIKHDETERFQNAYIHRLVAECWIDNFDNKPSVNHIDGNKLNNHKNNLEWMTYSEQQKHRCEVLNKKPQGKKLGQYDKQGKLIHTFNSVEEAAKSLNTSRVNIDNAIHHKKGQKTAYGYVWAYLE